MLTLTPMMTGSFSPLPSASSSACFGGLRSSKNTLLPHSLQKLCLTFLFPNTYDPMACSEPSPSLRFSLIGYTSRYPLRWQMEQLHTTTGYSSRGGEMEKVNLTAPQWQLALWSEYFPVGGGNGGDGMATVRLEDKLKMCSPAEFLVGWLMVFGLAGSATETDDAPASFISGTLDGRPMSCLAPVPIRKRWSWKCPRTRRQQLTASAMVLLFLSSSSMFHKLLGYSFSGLLMSWIHLIGPLTPSAHTSYCQGTYCDGIIRKEVVII